MTRRDPSAVPAPRSVPVLMYHEIDDWPVTPAFRPFVVPPGQFEEHLDALAEAGYRTAVASELAGAEPPAPDTVFITFDDAYASFADRVAPMLGRRGMTATVFAPTAYVGGRAEWLRPVGEDRRRLLDWIDLRDLARGGFEVGGHSHRHPELDVIRRANLLTELRQSRRILEDRLERAVETVAYPFGYNDAAVRRVAQLSGYRVACEVGYGLHRVGADLMRVRRLQVGPDVDGDGLIAMLTEHRHPIARGGRAVARPLWRTVRRVRAGKRAA